MGWLDILILALVALAFIGAVLYSARQTKKGKCPGCGGGDCSCCSVNTKKKK